MKILLINPWEGEIFPAPSIGYLQAALKTSDVEVEAKDLNQVTNWNYDLVGVSFHSFSVKYARYIREQFKGHLICGGHHPSALPDQMLSIGYDQVVIGEGENAILDILYGNKNKVIKESRWKYFTNINEIPFPDYSGLKFTGEMGLPIISSRGCPFDCNFCASSDFWHRRYETRSVENVINEIVLSGYKMFMFEDDNFTMKRQRAIEICSELANIGGFQWQCASRAESLIDDELCWNLKNAGCHTIWLGIESLSQSSLDRCGKNTTVEKMITGIKNAHKYGLETMSQFIVGLPGDKESDILETVDKIKSFQIGRKGVNLAWILPGTEIYRKAKERGFDDESYLTGIQYYTYEQDINTLNHWANLINAA